MALFTSTPVSVIPQNQKSAGNANMQATDLSANSRTIADPTTARLLTQAGAAMLTLQQQIDIIMRFLRADLPQPPTISAADPKGNLIAWVGYNVINNVVYEGGWFKQFYVGGDNAANAVISSDASGNVTITGAEIILVGSGATIVLDPVLGEIIVTQTGGGRRVTIGGIGITLDDSTGTPSDLVTLTPSSIQLNSNDANLYQINLSTGGGQNIFAPTGSFTLSRVVDLYGYSGATSNGPIISFTQFRGTGQTPTATQNGDTIGGFVAYGFDGSGESNYPVGIRGVATQNHSAGSQGAEIVFETTPNGSNVATASFTINNSGSVNSASGYLTAGVPGISGVALLAKLTALGTIGSITFLGGIAIAYTPPT